MMGGLLFLFKQKTSYEMRISDWSSDVCSSYLDDAGALVDRLVDPFDELSFVVGLVEADGAAAGALTAQRLDLGQGRAPVDLGLAPAQPVEVGTVENEERLRSEERRVGNECVSQFRSRWTPAD